MFRRKRQTEDNSKKYKKLLKDAKTIIRRDKTK